MSKKPVNNTNCCVFGCNSRKSRNKEIHFHYFPKKNVTFVNVINPHGTLEEHVCKRKAWLSALKIERPITKYMRVCSKHFKNKDYRSSTEIPLKCPKLKRTAVPSLNLPNTTSKERRQFCSVENSASAISVQEPEKDITKDERKKELSSEEPIGIGDDTF